METNINDIQNRYETLKSDLKLALSTMELSERVMKIREEMHDLQLLCPHNMGSYDFSTTDECPYCGKKFKG